MKKRTEEQLAALDAALLNGTISKITAARLKGEPVDLPTFSPDIRPHERGRALSEWADKMGVEYGPAFNTLFEFGTMDADDEVEVSRRLRNHGVEVAEPLYDASSMRVRPKVVGFWTALSQKERERLGKKGTL